MHLTYPTKGLLQPPRGFSVTFKRSTFPLNDLGTLHSFPILSAHCSKTKNTHHPPRGKGSRSKNGYTGGGLCNPRYTISVFILCLTIHSKKLLPQNKWNWMFLDFLFKNKFCLFFCFVLFLFMFFYPFDVHEVIVYFFWLIWIEGT